MRYDKIEACLSVHVVQGSGPNLLGRDWMEPLQVNLKTIHVVNPGPDPIQKVLDAHAQVFDDSEAGCLKGPPVKLVVNGNSQPKFYRPRSLPLLWKPLVEEELRNLQQKGIISPVQFSPWAAPLVPVLKKNGKMRLCGDFKLTINQASPTETYPLPHAEELFSKLAGGKFFSKLDLANAYLQLPLDEASRQYVTINTHKGSFNTIVYLTELPQPQQFFNATWRCYSRA